MSDLRKDTVIGDAAISKGWISKPQLEEVNRAAELVKQAGIDKSLADIMVEKGIITPVQAKTLEAAASDNPKQIIGGFELMDKLGEGGMGAVYKAKQLSMDRMVALKVLPQALAQNDEFIERFMREARMAAKLDHINIIRGIDVGQDGNVYYFAMEFVKGKSIGDMLDEKGKLDEDEVIHIGIQVARALDHAWKEAKLIHRDIKPDNILITEKNVAKVADLGLARTTDQDSTMMTRTGVAMGTPHYISPEQARGERDIDVRTDIYSLGATFYHMLAGQTPFSGTTAAAVITKHLMEPLAPVHSINPKISEKLSRIIWKMMQKDRAARYATPAELLVDLELVAQGSEPKSAQQITVGSNDPGASMSLMSAEQLQSLGLAPAGNKMLVPAIVGSAAVVVLAIVLAVVLLGGGSDDEQKAVKELAVVEKLIAADNLSSAHARAIEGAAVYSDTEQGPKFEALAARIGAMIAERKTATENAGSTKSTEEELKLAEEKKRLEDEKKKLEDRTKAAALAEANAILDRARVLVGEKKFGEARSGLTAGAATIEGAGLKEKMQELVSFIAKAEKEHQFELADRKAEAEDKAKIEADRKAKAGERARLVGLGDGLVKKGEYGAATDLYGKAQAITQTADVADKIADCQYHSSVAEGRDAEAKGDLDGAIAAYRAALKVKQDEMLLDRLGEVLARKKNSAAAEELGKSVLAANVGVTTDAGKLAATLDDAKRAIKAAGKEEAEALQKRAEELQSLLDYRSKLDEAGTHAAGNEWREAAAAAAEALSLVPNDPAATEILRKAEKALDLPKRIVLKSVDMPFVLVPGGTFTMGAANGEEDERPVVPVSLQGFYMGTFEVTNAQFEKFDANHAKERGKYSKAPETPVVNVTWDEATGFCRWLSAREGRTIRLPTEAEWEYAARGTDGRTYPWGSDAPETGKTFRANFGEGKSERTWGRDGYPHTAPVGSFANFASPFGCQDLAGNVWEWCADWYGPYPASARPVVSPTGSASGTERVLRGGSWYHDAASLRCANRWSRKPSVKSSVTGFRCVVEPE
jgi:formylglycine-generating enzyme required for sulfatase activity